MTAAMWAAMKVRSGRGAVPVTDRRPDHRRPMLGGISPAVFDRVSESGGQFLGVRQHPDRRTLWGSDGAR